MYVDVVEFSFGSAVTEVSVIQYLDGREKRRQVPKVMDRYIHSTLVGLRA